MKKSFKICLWSITIPGISKHQVSISNMYFYIMYLKEINHLWSCTVYIHQYKFNLLSTVTYYQGRGNKSYKCQPTNITCRLNSETFFKCSYPAHQHSPCSPSGPLLLSKGPSLLFMAFLIPWRPVGKWAQSSWLLKGTTQEQERSKDHQAEE